MPWKCPACQTQINHDGDRPEFRRVYRCHVCRLELVLDAATDKLTVAPLPINPNQAGAIGTHDHSSSVVAPVRALSPRGRRRRGREHR
jgi:hypothetical protein